MPSESLGSESDTVEPVRRDATLPTGETLVRTVGFESEVAVVRWPGQEQELEELAVRDAPRLLLVSPGSMVPASTSCFQDWVRLPVDDGELRARLYSLSERYRRHARPTIDEFGILRRNGAFAIVSQGEQTLARLLIAEFGSVVRDEILEEHIVSDVLPRRSGLRTQTSRLRKRLAPLGLTVSCIRGIGYMMHEDTGGTSPSHAMHAP